VDENLSEAESSNSDNEIGDNQNLITKLVHNTGNKVTGKQLQLSVHGVM
jgi:hypothetical protein